ncbi:hypothetical protein ACJMK2_037074 [Sinanodonta woodiana]|uniref:Uncharacterized protein n=1 Tax=Sinanodonta woodiana TaxID=1069815 RepID=A0ABD3WMQ8_SINWO
MFRRAFMLTNAARESAIRGQRISAHILGIGIFMVGVMVLSVALILGLGFPRYVNERITDDQCILNKDHKFYYAWVSDADHVNYNRLYYWTIKNKADFLYGGANPEVVERGPYVYRETRTKFNIQFYNDRVTFQTMRTQTFAEELTKRECGQQCLENDTACIMQF